MKVWFGEAVQCALTTDKRGSIYTQFSMLVTHEYMWRLRIVPVVMLTLTLFLVIT